MSSFAIAAAEPSLEIQKYRLQSGRIWEMVKNFRRIHTIACRRQEEKLGGWKILGRCCLRRMRCGRIFGHMRFEALGSRSFPVVDAYSSWMHWHQVIFGIIVIFSTRLWRRIACLLCPPGMKIKYFSTCSKSSKFDKNSS